MIATTEEELADLFRDAILAMTPRLTYEGAEAWKGYDKEVGGASRTRRFRLVFGRPRLRQGRGSVMAGNTFAHDTEMRVRTDYAGDHSEVQFLVIDDFLQLRDVLSGLKASDNGLLLVEPIGTFEEGTNRPAQFIESVDVKKVDHTYSLRYLRSIAP